MWRKTGAKAALLLAVSLAVTGCGGNNKDAADTSTKSTVADSTGTDSTSIENADADTAGDDSASAGDSGTEATAADLEGYKAAENIFIENINVSGMDQAEITQAINTKMQELSASTIILSAGGSAVAVTAQDFGLTYTNTDVIRQALETGQKGDPLKRFEAAYRKQEEGPLILELRFAVNEDLIRQTLANQASPLQKPAVNMGLVRNEDGSFTSTPGEDGWMIDTEAAVQTIKEFFTNEWRGGRAGISLASVTVAGKGTEEQFAQVRDVLGQSQTSYADSSDVRKQNIQVGVSLINGSVVYPGEEFSVEAVTQPYTAEHGYAPAPSYEMGSVVDTYGGGLCQVSTTLYLAILNSELEVTERSSHSMLVNYVEPSMDAAVAQGVKDFKFVNNTDAPIYIMGTADGSTLSFSIFGHETREAGRVVTYESETLETTAITDAADTDSELPWGQTRGESGHLGAEARLWKVVTVNGVQESRTQINDSEYNMAPNTVYYGTKGASDEAVNELEAALENKDMAAVSAVVAKYNGQF